MDDSVRYRPTEPKPEVPSLGRPPGPGGARRRGSSDDALRRWLRRRRAARPCCPNDVDGPTDAGLGDLVQDDPGRRPQSPSLPALVARASPGRPRCRHGAVFGHPAAGRASGTQAACLGGPCSARVAPIRTTRPFRHRRWRRLRGAGAPGWVWLDRQRDLPGLAGRRPPAQRRSGHWTWTALPRWHPAARSGRGQPGGRCRCRRDGARRQRLAAVAPGSAPARQRVAALACFGRVEGYASVAAGRRDGVVTGWARLPADPQHPARRVLYKAAEPDGPSHALTLAAASGGRSGEPVEDQPERWRFTVPACGGAGGAGPMVARSSIAVGAQPMGQPAPSWMASRIAARRAASAIWRRAIPFQHHAPGSPRRRTGSDRLPASPAASHPQFGPVRHQVRRPPCPAT